MKADNRSALRGSADVIITKKTPTADDFTFTAPTDTVYSGDAKAADVAAKPGLTGMGEVTVKYFSDEARTTEAEPVDAGTYYVGITVAEGDINVATADNTVLYNAAWKFEITKPAPTVTPPAPYGPYYVQSGTTPTVPTTPAVTPTPAATSSVKMWAVQNADKSSITVSWDKVSGATKYTLYVRKNGKLEKVVETKKTKVLIKNVANNTSLEYVLKYTINGIESAENSAYTASIKVNYKPAVKLTASKGSVMIKWSKVPGATKYRVYKYVNGSLKLITETTKSAVRVTGTKSGKEYSYAVKAYVDGKWTKVYGSDIATVTAK